MEGELKDMDMAAAAQQLMQLSGDEDEESKHEYILSSASTQTHNENINKRKSSKNVVAAQSCDAQSFSTNYSKSDSLSMRPKKRTRYRSIMHLYMATKPV